jgi:putative flippase GtrA
VGNLGVMRVLVGGAGMPVMAANAVAIVCCSVVNFGLGEWWAFAEEKDAEPERTGRLSEANTEILAAPESQRMGVSVG